MLGELWAAYADAPHDYPIYFFYSSDLWNPDRYPCIRDSLGLNVTVDAPIKEAGDVFHREVSPDLISPIRKTYAGLSAKMDAKVKSQPPCFRRTPAAL